MGRSGSRKFILMMIVAFLAMLVAGSVLVWSSVSSLRTDDESERPPDIAGTGSFVVGSDIVFGTYRSEGAAAGCRWEINFSGSPLQRGRGSEEVEVTLDRKPSLFRTMNCGTWKWVEE